MINWIIGGLIAVATIYIIFRTITNIKNGKSACSCDGCNSGKCGNRNT